MIQPKNLLQLIERVRPTAALFTTYTFDVCYFDVVILPKLREVGCEVIAVLVDADRAAKCASDFNSREAGRKYRIATVIAPNGGVFHPKLAYLVGKSDHALSVGSGNLTAAGLAVQLESFDAVSALQTPRVFAELQTWMLDLATRISATSVQACEELRRFAALAEGSAHLSQGEKRPDKAKYVAIEGREPPTLVHTLDTAATVTLRSLFLARAGSASQVTVLAPFHAPDGGPVLRLARSVKARSLQVGVDGRVSPLTAPFALERFKKPARFRFVTAHLGDQDDTMAEPDADDDTGSSEGEDGDSGGGTYRIPGRLHAKVFVLQAQNEALVVTGSVNATSQSLEGVKNVEVSLARWLPKSPFRWAPVKTERYAITQAPSDFALRCRFYVEAWLDGSVLQGVLSPLEKVPERVRFEVTNDGKPVLVVEHAKTTEAGKFRFQLTVQFDQKAGLQLAAIGDGAVACCFVNILEELRETPTERPWDSRDRDAFGRLRAGHCSIEDLTRLLERFIPGRRPDRGGLGNPGPRPPDSPSHPGETPVPPSRALKELSRAARLAAEALKAPSFDGRGADSEPGGQARDPLPSPRRRSRANQPVGRKGMKPNREDDAAEQSLYRSRIFWSIVELHDKHPAHEDSVAIAAFAAHWALDIASSQNGPELCSVWLERFAWHQYPEGERASLAPLAAAMARTAVLVAEQRSKPPALSLLRESVERFAGDGLAEERLMALCAEGLQLDTFGSIVELALAGLSDFATRLLSAPALDDRVLSLLRKARSGARRNLQREPEASGFESIAKELQTRHDTRSLLEGLVAEPASSCPICYRSLEDSHRVALRRHHMVKHHPGCGRILFKHTEDEHLRRQILELPGA